MFSATALVAQIIEIAIFVPLIVVGLSRLGAYLVKTVAHEENAYFLVMLLEMTIAAALPAAVNLHGIIGAFLAGVVVNAAVHDQPAKERLKVIGDSLFVPAFFVVTGFPIQPTEFCQSITENFALTATVILALLAGKWFAPQIAGKAFGYFPTARMTIWALTLAEVAATLAATLAAFDTFDRVYARLIDTRLLNVVLILMLTTSILGLVLTERFAPRMLPDPKLVQAA
jgi:Kef-type K+ transport system membrane component KefB